jgi:hypothetical protein
MYHTLENFEKLFKIVIGLSLVIRVLLPFL